MEKIKYDNSEIAPKDLNEALKVIGEMKDKYKGLERVFRKFVIMFTVLTSIAGGIATYKWNENKEKDTNISENLKKMKNIIATYQYHVAPSSESKQSDGSVVWAGREVKENTDVDPRIFELEYLINNTKKELE